MCYFTKVPMLKLNCCYELKVLVSSLLKCSHNHQMPCHTNAIDDTGYWWHHSVAAETSRMLTCNGDDSFVLTV